LSVLRLQGPAVLPATLVSPLTNCYRSACYRQQGEFVASVANRFVVVDDC